MNAKKTHIEKQSRTGILTTEEFERKNPKSFRFSNYQITNLPNYQLLL